MRRSPVILLVSAAIGVTALACASQPSEVDHLRAFAKLYGYVRFFHPSDAAAELDWERFAVYGVREVRGARTKEELRAVLEELFLPIAPTLQIYGAADRPTVMSDSLVPPDAADLDLVAWQHLGVDLGADLAAEAHRSVRLNRTMAEPPEPTSASFWQKLDARPYRGNQLELRAAVRTDGDIQATLALYAQHPDFQMGFGDFMVDRPITSESWDTYVLAGTVDEEADSIGIGGSIAGSGTAWFDDFRLRVRDEGAWRPVPLNDGDFESGATWWSTLGEGYEFEVTTGLPHHGERAFMTSFPIESQLAPPLFERRPTSGEVVERSLGAALAARIPIALHSRDGQTIRPADAPSTSDLVRELADVAEADWSDPSLRLADVVVAWNVLQHFYPYFDVLDVDWDELLTSTLANAISDDRAHDFFVPSERWYPRSTTVMES